MRYALRPISSCEYDAAVKATPHLCPLAAMGDLRTGRELLADAARDLAASHFAAGPGVARHTPALMRRFLAARCAELQAELRPCVNGCQRGESMAEANAICGGLPAALWGESKGPAEECATPEDWRREDDGHQSEEWWARGPLRAFWAFGQRRDGLAALFESLPAAFADRLRLAVDAAAAAYEDRAADVASAEAALAGLGASPSKGGAEEGPLLDPAELWEAEAEWGYATAAFDPATGRRRPGSVRVNGRQASPHLRSAAPRGASI